MNNYRRTLVEVNEVLNHLSKENFDKIPEEIIKIINENRDNNYKWTYNENLPLERQKLSKDAIIILSWINMNFFVNSEQRDFLNQIHEKNERKKFLMT